MSDSDFTFEAKGLENLDKAGKLAQQKILQSCSNYMIKKTHERIRSGIDVDGKPFEPRKFKPKSNSPRTLFDGGELFRSISSTNYEDYCMVFSNIPYAKYHNEGRDYKASKKQAFWMWANLFNKEGNPFAIYNIHLPKRHFLGISDEDTENMKKLASNILKKEMGGE
jgi:phage gpG-like protein